MPRLPRSGGKLVLFLLLALALSTAAFANVPAYVDDDAPNDPGPGDLNVSDPLEDGSPDHPFDSIQEAMDFLLSPCELIVLPGTYHEAISTPGAGCVIAGSGKSTTIVSVPSGDVLTGYAGAEVGHLLGTLSVSGMTLIGGSGNIQTFLAQDTVPESVEILLQDLDLRVSGFSLQTQSPEPGDVARFSLKSVNVFGSLFLDATGSGPGEVAACSLESVNVSGEIHLHTSALGGLVTCSLKSVGLIGPLTILNSGIDLDLTVDSLQVGAFGTQILFNTAGARLRADVKGIVAPDAGMQLRRSAGGGQEVSLQTGFLGGLDTRGPEYAATVQVRNIQFSGTGILTGSPGEGGTDITISGCTFQQGGVDILSREDIDGGSSSTTRISDSTFHDSGVSFSALTGSRFGVADILTVDSSYLSGAGISVHLQQSADPTTASYFDFSFTNNVINTNPYGIRLVYTLPDATSSTPRAVVNASIVNNTFHGNGGTGIAVSTNDHAPGQATVTTLLQNNIVAGAATGVEILGTDDHAITILSNDVHAATGYSGDVADPTGTNGNISGDPFFADAPGGDFSLSGGSPCVDTGTPGASVPAVDFDGVFRPQDGDNDGTPIVDMGAFELILVDQDGDGFGPPGDCNDNNPAVNPSAPDLPGDTVDQNCDGTAVCSPVAVYKTHGQFVRCVVQSCNQLVRDGLVSRSQCDALVEQASRASVGRRQRSRPVRFPQEP